MMTHESSYSDVAVIGGGVGGLAAAIYAARSGRSVTLFEKAQAAGGRAATQVRGEFHFNLGPHALYVGGEGMKALRELKIAFTGRSPRPQGWAIAGGRKHALPGTPLSLFTTTLLPWRAKFEVARLLGGFPRLASDQLQRTTVRDWMDGRLRHPQVRQLVAALFRLATYANDIDAMSAGAAIHQFQLALAKNVWYLDGGWQTLIDGLLGAARQAGVQVVTSARVDGVEPQHDEWQLRLTDRTHRAGSVMVAVPPDTAAAIVRSDTLRRWATSATPVKAACLDVALSRLPDPRATFALGIDRPLYLSVHSATARLAPAGAATIQVAKYLPTGSQEEPRFIERELDELLDLVQPGWREVCVDRRFLPSMVVSNGLVTAVRGGTPGRPGPAVPDASRLYVVGDWVGPKGMLVDASLASARLAATMISAAPARAAAA